jgi:hypothetical protein
MRRLLGDLAFRFRAIFARARADQELDEELAHHRSMLIAELRSAGASPADAAREAARRIGSDAGQRETVREGWGVSLLSELAADMRYALRQMRRHLGFTVIAVLTVGLGIGVTVALASVANSVILRALPYGGESSIHVFWSDYNWQGAEYDFVRERKGIFTHLAAYSTNGDTYATDARSPEGARLLPFVVATPSLFDVLGVRSELGPGLTPDDDLPNAAPVIVISHAMWQGDLGGDPQVIGRRILIGGEEVTIVGVMPKEFYFPTPFYRRGARSDSTRPARCTRWGTWCSSAARRPARRRPG